MDFVVSNYNYTFAKVLKNTDSSTAGGILRPAPVGVNSKGSDSAPARRCSRSLTILKDSDKNSKA